MKVIWVISIVILSVLSSCNLAEWNQMRLTKKFASKEVTEQTLDVNGHHIHYFEGGNLEGQTLLLIHGFGGDAQVTWNKTIIDLSKKYRIIAPDLLWFGQSLSNHKPDIYAQINALEYLLDELKVDTFSVAGISYGGFVTMGLAQKRESQVNKMIIIDSPGITYNVVLLDSMVAQTGVNEVSDIFVPKNADQVQFLLNFASYKKKRIPKGILMDAYDLYFSKNHEELKQLIVTLPNQKQEFLDKGFNDIPNSKVIWGENDEVFPLSEGKKLADYLEAEILIINKSGHAPNLEQFKSFEKLFRYSLTD